MTIYSPELGEIAPVRLFHGQYVHKNYSIEWSIANDQAARTALAQLRIYPRGIKRMSANEWNRPTDIYVALITAAAMHKLDNTGLIAIRTLLD